MIKGLDSANTPAPDTAAAARQRMYEHVRNIGIETDHILGTLSDSLNKFAAVASGDTSATPRELLLREAESLVCGSRNATYGNPEDNFRNIAESWNVFMWQREPGSRHRVFFGPQDVAHMMILLKLARLATNPNHRDSLVDIAGYAACAADCQAAR